MHYLVGGVRCRRIDQVQNQRASFRWNDIYIPDRMDVSRELLESTSFEGQVLDITKNELTQEIYVVISVDRVKTPLILPLDKVIFVKTNPDD